LFDLELREVFTADAELRGCAAQPREVFGFDVGEDLEEGALGRPV